MYKVLYDTKTGKILQWQDWTKFNYAEPSEGLATLDLTEEEFTANKDNMTFVNNGSLSNVDPYPPTLAEIQAQAIAQLNSYASQYLSKSDYIVIKKSEGVTLTTNDNTLLTDRENFRAWLATTKSSINAATTIAAVQAINLTYGG